MSKIYVSWPKLQHMSQLITLNANTIMDCAADVERACSRLQLSDEVLSSIKSGLSKNTERLYELSDVVTKYAQALDMISRLYKTAEEKNVKR